MNGLSAEVATVAGAAGGPATLTGPTALATPTAPAATATLAARPITLEELLAVAELQTRTDRKYLVPTSAVTPLLAETDPDLRVLEIEGRTGHRYASRYLDTPALDAFMLAAHGRPRRFKVRTRIYCDSGDRFLEVKTRGRRGETVKDRLPCAEATHAELTRFAPATVRARTGHELAALAPTLEVTYTRSTYLLPASGSRVTIDTDLTWRIPTLRMGHDGAASARSILATPALTVPALTVPALTVPTLTLLGWAVVETKTLGRACTLDRLLWRTGRRPLRLSKYTCGLALIGDAALPANRWHRTLERLASSAVVVPAVT